jgi:hypothetical protein
VGVCYNCYVTLLARIAAAAWRHLWLWECASDLTRQILFIPQPLDISMSITAHLLIDHTVILLSNCDVRHISFSKKLRDVPLQRLHILYQWTMLNGHKNNWRQFLMRPAHSMTGVQVLFRSRVHKSFQTSGSHLKILDARKVTWRTFHTVDPQILGVTVQDWVARAIRRP